jgi:asparagine synthase (glutamine-hydrolysing)
MSWMLHIKDLNKDELERKNIESAYVLSTQFSSRFVNDKTYAELEHYLVVLDGIILNSSEMKALYHTESISEVLIAAYEKKGKLFMNDLKGSFNGAIYDRRINLWIIFVSQYGDRPLFYYKNGQNLFISSSFNDIADCVKNLKGKYIPNEKAAYYILTYGYMIDESTHVEGISRLMPGDYISIYNQKAQIQSYFKFSNLQTNNISFDDAIEGVDVEFRKAIKRIYDKDLEYGYMTHLADMSGGLDSRMASWVAHEMGYEDITNICYAQSQSKEWKVAMKVANTLNNDFIYMPLDKCNFIYDIDKIIDMNYGLAVYAGITGGRRLLERLNSNFFGLEITGQLGDVVVGSFIKEKPIHNPPVFYKNMYSNFLQYSFDVKLLKKYDNMEIFSLYNRGFLGALSSHLIRNNYIDAISPFCDVDFLSFCLSIPLKYRFNHKLYHAWIVRKYPKCAEISTSNYDSAITENMYWTQAKRLIKKGPGFISRNLLNKLGMKLKGSPKTMNPIQYWYATDYKLRKFIEDYYNKNKERIAIGTKLYIDIENMFYNGTVMDKLLVLTVLATYKRYDLWVIL